MEADSDVGTLVALTLGMQKFSVHELAVLSTYLPGQRGGKRAVSDERRCVEAGLTHDQVLQITNDLRTRLAAVGEPTWAVNLATHARAAFGGRS